MTLRYLGLCGLPDSGQLAAWVLGERTGACDVWAGSSAVSVDSGNFSFRKVEVSRRFQMSSAVRA